jgi:hypothetical protein
MAEGLKFPKGDWTKFSNGTLEAMMQPGQPPGQRIFACACRKAWGYGKQYVVNGDGKPATRKNFEDWLDMSKQQVSFHVVAFQESDWLREDNEGRLFPNPYPKPEPPSAPENDPEPVFPGLPTREEFRALQDPNFATDKAELLDKWNKLRTRQRELDNAYDALVAEIAAKSEAVNGTVDANEETSQRYKPENAAVPLTKFEAHPYMSSKKERKKNTEQAGRPLLEETPEPERAARLPADPGEDPLKTLLEKYAWNIGKSADEGEVAAIYKALRKAPVEQLATRLAARIKGGLQLHSYKGIEKIAREDCAPHPWVVQVAPPGARLTLEEEIETALQLAERPEWADDPRRADWIADLEELEKERPELVARLRERLAKPKTRGAS